LIAVKQSGEGINGGIALIAPKHIPDKPCIGIGLILVHNVPQQGDTVIVNRSKPYDSGDIVAVAIGSGNVTLKRIIKKDTSILLVSENSLYEPMVFGYGEFYNLPVTVLGRAVELRRRF
jgi:SOS-response transcriptional repressor LexA